MSGNMSALIQAKYFSFLKAANIKYKKRSNRNKVNEKTYWNFQLTVVSFSMKLLKVKKQTHERQSLQL